MKSNFLHLLEIYITLKLILKWQEKIETKLMEKLFPHQQNVNNSLLLSKAKVAT